MQNTRKSGASTISCVATRVVGLCSVLPSKRPIFFCCRSAVFVTKAFNFILVSHSLATSLTRLIRCLLEHEILIRFVAFNAYASAVDLGWDPTIHHIVSANSTVRYKITVHQCDTGGKVVKTDYLTTRLLYDSGAEARRGRGTWVFEAYRLEGSEEARAPVAIKDI
jgi:hypothetical protein